MPDYDRLFIDGAFVASTGDDRVALINPYTELRSGAVAMGTAADADRAVRAAAAALPAWSATPLPQRVAACTAIAAGLRQRQHELAMTVATELGAPWSTAVMVQTGLPLVDFASMADVADRVAWEVPSGGSLLVRQPAGVVAAIAPWNYPLHQIAAKVAPALVAGCTVVVKPATQVPGVAAVLAEVVEAAGLPPGVLNVVTGSGPVVGEALASHELVDMVSFTGSTRAGRRVAELAARGPRRTALELGGKSASVLLDDLSDRDLARAVAASFAGCMINAGQTCSALTRLVVPRDRLPDVEQVLATRAEQVVLGDPLDPTTTMGPLVSATQRDAVRGHITRAVDDGARLVCGGAEHPAEQPHGFFVAPTVLSDVAPGMPIEQEEVFGPVLVVVAYEGDDEHARAIADGTPYGLSGAVWSADPQRATALARRMRTGQVAVNGAPFDPTAAFGGFGGSGYGRELGPLGIEEFTTVTAVQLAAATQQPQEAS